jgi:hypothetical protein
MTAWIFPEKSPAQKARNPISDEFFDSPEVLTDISSLVRESIQNSIDARVDSTAPVIVKFTIGTLDGAASAPFFSGLQAHLSSVFEGPNAPAVNNQVRFLALEDFNTTGLAGDTRIDTAPLGQEAGSSYTYFIHVEGASNKGEGKKGKWGVGKIVFQKLSAIKTFFVYTERPLESAPDGETRLWVGQSILKFHNIGGKTFQPDGWFAKINADQVFAPYTGAEADTLASSWGISRSNEPGLSVVIPYIPTTVQISAIRDSIIREYFVPIIKGDLSCVLVDENGETTELTSANLDQIAKDVEMERALLSERTSAEMEEAIGLVSDAERNETSDFNISIPDDLSKITDYSLDDDTITLLREQFEGGHSIRLRCKVSVPDDSASSLASDVFDILLRKSSISSSVTFYAREGILVPGRRNRSLNNCISLVLVESGPLANLLGAAEGPAHDSWSAGTDKFKSKYGASTKASRLIPIVRGVADRILQLLSSQSGSFDLHILDEFFKVPNKPKSIIDPPNPPDTPVTPPVKPPILPPQVQLANIRGKGNGFEVYTSEHSDLTNCTLTIRLAYEVSRGNPFSKYSPLDFDLATMTPAAEGCAVTHQSQNTLVIEISEKQFSVSCEGFDLLRDLEVRLEMTKGPGSKAVKNA